MNTCLNCNNNGCPEIISGKCVKYTGSYLQTLAIGSSDTFNSALIKINNYLANNPGGLTKVYTSPSSTITFTGTGTQSNPLIANFIGSIPGPGDFISNQIVSPQSAGFYINKPSKIEYINDTTGTAPGALEVYRTLVNSTTHAPVNVRSVFRVSSTSPGFNDIEFASVYGGLHVNTDNVQPLTNATEGIVGVAGTASNLGNANVAFMSAFSANAGNSPTSTGIIDKYTYYKITKYTNTSNPGKVNRIAGFATPKLTPGNTSNIHWLSGIGDVTVSTQLIGNTTWPDGNWNMYDASGYKNYLSGSTLIGTLTDDTTSTLQVSGTTRTIKVVGGTSVTDTLSLQNYTTGTTGAIIDQYGMTIGGGSASTNTMLKLTRSFSNPTTNVYGLRAEQSVAYTTAPTVNALFGALLAPTIGSTNTQNWTVGTNLHGISVAPTINNGATGTIENVIGGTFDLNLRSSVATVTNAIGVRIFTDPLMTTPITNLTLLAIGYTSSVVPGNWSIYNTSTFPSYMGSGNMYINTASDSGSGAKLQVNGGIEIYGSNNLKLNTGRVLLGNANMLSGTGSPEGIYTAPVGSVYLRLDGTTGTTIYMKESGTGNTGWGTLASSSQASNYTFSNTGFTI